MEGYIFRGIMKVFTKITQIITLSLALTQANSAIAAGWLSYAPSVPSWMSLPISKVYSYISPYMPATKKDAQEIQTAFKTELSAAELLLQATQKNYQKSHVRLQAGLEDLKWLEERTRAFTKEQTDTFLEHYDALTALNESQDENYRTLQDSASKVSLLKNQMAAAVVALNKANDTFTALNQNVLSQIDAVEQKLNHKHSNLTLYTNVQFDKHDQEYKLAELKLVGLNKKMQDLHSKVDAHIEEIEEDVAEKAQLIEKLEQTAAALERQNARIMARRAKRNNTKKIASSHALQQATIALVSHRETNI